MPPYPFQLLEPHGPLFVAQAVGVGYVHIIIELCIDNAHKVRRFHPDSLYKFTSSASLTWIRSARTWPADKKSESSVLMASLPPSQQLLRMISLNLTGFFALIYNWLQKKWLPSSDPFWDSYIPPLDWNCRCTVLQVLKNKYPLTYSAQAIRNGEAATTRIDKNGVNRAAMFRFNPGKQKVVFPQNHPYFKVQQGVKDAIDALLTPHSEKAKAAKELVSWCKQNLPSTKIGKFVAKRFEVRVAKLDQPVVINANFYNEIISKYKNDKNYALKLETAKKAHELISVADFVLQEDARHGKNKFNVYITSYNNKDVIMKVRITADGNFLHYLLIR